MTRVLPVPALMAAVLIGLAGCDEPKPRRPPPPAAAAQPLPALPAWAGELVGRPLAEALPGPPGACLGNTDAVGARYAGAPAGVQVVGWGWDRAAKAPVRRVVLVDIAARVVGAGEGGLPRPDVNAAVAEVTSPTTGWAAYAPRTAGPLDAYGLVDDGRAICRLGHLEF
jgi:hypothetical protein